MTAICHTAQIGFYLLARRGYRGRVSRPVGMAECMRDGRPVPYTGLEGFAIDVKKAPRRKAGFVKVVIQFLSNSTEKWRISVLRFFIFQSKGIYAFNNLSYAFVENW